MQLRALLKLVIIFRFSRSESNLTNVLQVIENFHSQLPNQKRWFLNIEYEIVIHPDISLQVLLYFSVHLSGNAIFYHNVDISEQFLINATVKK